MKNMSIRTKIIACVSLVMLVGAVTVAVYLHQTFSRGLNVAARDSVALAKGSWEDIVTHGTQKAGFGEFAKSGPDLVGRLKKMTGSDYGLLLLKSAGDAKSYADVRSAAGVPNNWDEGETYVLAGVTDEGLAAKMTIGATPDSVPEIGKTVGIENGACSKTCHGSVKGTGDFWGVGWSDDAKSRAYTVVPVNDAAGKPIGLLYTVSDISSLADADRASMIQTLGVIALGLAAGTVAIAVLLNVLIFRRLRGIVTAMEEIGLRVAGGDFDARFAPDGSGDEIGEFEVFFSKFLDLVTSMLKSLTKKSA